MSLKRVFRLHLPTLLAQLAVLSGLLFLNLRDRRGDDFEPPPPGQPSPGYYDLKKDYGWPFVVLQSREYYMRGEVNPSRSAELFVRPLVGNLGVALAILTAAAVVSIWYQRRATSSASAGPSVRGPSSTPAAARRRAPPSPPQ